MKYIASTILFLTILIGCGTENKKAPLLTNISFNATGELELGTLDSTEYHNKYFGFSFSCPIDKWSILNTEQYAHRLEANKENFSASDKTWKRTTDNLHNLLTIEKKSSDPTVHAAQSISFTAEGLEKIPNVNSALEYLQYADKFCKEHLSANYPKYTVTGIDTALVGNRTFLVESLIIQDTPDIKRFQKTYSAQFGKYLLNILVNYYTDTEQKDNETVLRQVKWE